MVDKNSGLNAPEDGLFHSRAFRAHSALMPPMAAGEEIIIWFAGKWRNARIVSRQPGGIYKVRFPSPVLSCEFAYLSSNTFGGFASGKVEGGLGI